MRVPSEIPHGVQACTVCGTDDLVSVLNIEAMPAHCNIQWPTREKALSAPKGDIHLRYCRSCGHVFNAVFDPEVMKYSQEYENSLHYSNRFNKYADELSDRLIRKYDLRDKDVIEIGCGKGDFLSLLCRKGNNRGTGFDASYEPDRQGLDPAVQMRIIPDAYSEKYSFHRADLVCCRHVLEHVQHPTEFLRSVRRAVGPGQGTVFYFEVPNVLYTIRDFGIWDLIYEHVSYFSAGSLAAAFSAAGFSPRAIYDDFDGQYLCIEAVVADSPVTDVDRRTDKLDEMARGIEFFAEKYRNKLREWRERLHRGLDKSARIVVWGGGSKGVTFLNALNLKDEIGYVVDVNPHKHGLYVAGTAQKIVPPQFLTQYRPEYVVIMNKIYRDEIGRTMSELGLDAEVLIA